MVRLVKSVSEMEGRFRETWVLVDEETELEPWGADEEFAFVGKPTPRIDGPKRVSGQARYTVDVVLPGMLHAEVLRSPYGHARVGSLDVDAALASPGVRAVLTADSPAASGSCKAILSSEPDYAGGPVAAVCADTLEAARAGIEALAADFEQLPHVIDFDEALRQEAMAEEPGEESRGDVEAAMRDAEVTVELTGETPGHLQSALEPHGAVVDFEHGEITAWVSTQGMFDARTEFADRFELPLAKVRVINEYVGGGFGAKQGAGKEALLAAEFSRQTGRPVRLVNDRHAEQLDGGIRAPTRQTYRLGAKRDGTLVAVEAEIVVGRGLPAWRAINTAAFTTYKVENAYSVEASLAFNSREGNAFRAPAVMEGITVFEQAMDELALELGLDPLDLRRKNHTDVDQDSGEPYTSKGLLACYDRAEQLSGWRDRDRLRDGSDGLLRGMGCATQIWWGGGGPPAHATIRLGGDGVATVVTGIQDIGTGTLTAAQMVAAEELGLPLDRVVVTGGDTQPNIYGPVAGGSQTTPSVMPAVRSAASVVKRKLLSLAGDVFEVSPDDLELRDGHIRSADRTLDHEYTEVVQKLGNATIDGSGMRGPNPDGFRTNTFGCQIAQIAVDPGTGEVKVEKIWAVHEIGRVVNPLGASSQAEGGILQGMAYALSEEHILDPTIGAPTNAWLDDYKVPTIADTPEITVEFVHLPDTRLSNVGSKGLGEPPIVPTAAAIANAFRHATGRRVTSLPLTRARVLEALAD